MYELIQACGQSYYIQSPAKMGLYRLDDSRVVLMDSGNDKDAGRKIRQLLEKNGWTLAAIYNTHSHADHIGGNKYLQTQTGCKVYAPGIERDFTEHTVLEPSLVYGGYPPKDLRHKFLLAQESAAEPLTEAVLPQGFDLIPLPGHCLDMVGFRTPDDVVYLADCLSSRETLEKYRIGYLYDVAGYLQTLETVKTMEAKLYVPAHAPAAEDIRELAQYNIDTVLEIAGRILDLCAQPLCFEVILQKLFTAYGLAMTFEQYALVGSTVRSYLAWLKETGRLTVEINNTMLLWRRA